eukprot:1369359-Amphidinium_carterae.3
MRSKYALLVVLRLLESATCAQMSGCTRSPSPKFQARALGSLMFHHLPRWQQSVSSTLVSAEQPDSEGLT